MRTKQEHIEIHKELHRSLDKLLADWIIEDPDGGSHLGCTVHELVKWSHQQTVDPSDRMEAFQG